MRTYDLSPLWRSTIGFDRLFDLAETAQRAGEDNYPPYNIERLAEDRFESRIGLELVKQDLTRIIAALDSPLHGVVHLWPLVGSGRQGGPLNPPKDLPTSARPLVNLSLAINYQIGQFDPTGYHAVSFALHALSALLLWAIVRRTLLLDYFRGKFDGLAGILSFAAALVWAVHPLNTESVAGLINTTSGVISGTPTTAGTSLVTVTATDSTGPSGSTSFTWTVSTSGGGGGCTAAQLLGNPGFETGTASPWTTSASVIFSGTKQPARTGSWVAWLDGYGTTHTDTLSQAVTLPTGCASYSFGFWLHVDTAETSTTTAFDKLQVQVLNGSGTVLATLATFSNLNAVTGYVQHSFSLASFAGQTVTLKFTGTEDSIDQTSFVLDDTDVNVS